MERMEDHSKDVAEGLLPGRPPVDRRLVINAIWHVLRTGCKWRMLLHYSPHWNSVYTIFRRYRQSGLFAMTRIKWPRERAHRGDHTPSDIDILLSGERRYLWEATAFSSNLPSCGTKYSLRLAGPGQSCIYRP